MIKKNILTLLVLTTVASQMNSMQNLTAPFVFGKKFAENKPFSAMMGLTGVLFVGEG